jgi:hypothetical protein
MIIDADWSNEFLGVKIIETLKKKHNPFYVLPI